MSKKVNILDKSVAYLAGPIDMSEDYGVSYRQEIIEETKKRGIGIKFLDPTHKLEALTPDVGEEQEAIRTLKKNRSWTKLRRLMRKIVRSDLRQVDISDFLIVMVDTSIHMCGTYHELILADQQKKPVLVIVKGGKTKASSWLFGIIDPKFMFDNVVDCIDYLDEVNRGKVELNHRWVLFRQELLRDE